jgi:hypothetical protein
MLSGDEAQADNAAAIVIIDIERMETRILSPYFQFAPLSHARCCVMTVAARRK